MNLEPSTLADLRALLSPIDAADAAVEALAAPMDAARSAAARLQTQLADVDQRIAATAIAPIAPVPADADRIEALIAGADVPKIDPKDVEAHAAAVAKAAVKARALNAERQQIAADLSAVQQRIAQLETQASGFRQERFRAERPFIVALGIACGKAYRRAITEFIETNMPPLMSVAQRVLELTGQLPAWHNHIVVGLAVSWPDESYVPDYPDLPAVRSRLHQLWPRYDDKLHSGEPLQPPGMIEQLIATVRASGSAAKTQRAEAAE